MKNSLLILFLITAFLSSACNKSSDTNVDHGFFEGNTYFNTGLGLSLSFPETWAVQSREVVKELSALGGDMLAGDNTALSSQQDNIDNNVTNLFYVFKHERGAPVEFNSNLYAAADNISTKPGIKSGADYFFHMKKIMQSSTLNYQLDETAGPKTISDVAFDILMVKITINNIAINQTFYAAKINEHILVFTLSFTTPEDQEQLESILAGLKITE